MSKWIEIEEIIRPATQGKSRPYYCRGSDGYFYFVKGRPRSSQGAEWICGHLARTFGLPIPEFEIVDVSQELLKEASDECRLLGEGPAFGSRAVDGVSWLERDSMGQVAAQLQTDILVFDYWIQNQDRTAFNPNLLWQAAETKLVVIDHNLAFDTDFIPKGFLEGHLFRAQWAMLDLERRADYGQRLAKALSALNAACSDLPKEWSWQDSEQTVPGNLDLDRIRSVLSRCNANDFWSAV